jgi:Outer membrane protein beta-barrel domain
MKKLLATTFVLLTLFSVCFGQKLQIGIRGGLGKTQLSSQKFNQDKYLGDAPLIRWNAGFSIINKINKRFFVETDFIMNRKGVVVYARVMDYTYASLSPNIIIKLRRNSEKNFQPFVKIGTYFAYLTKFESNSNGNGPFVDIFYLTYSQPRHFDRGLKMALGFDYKISPKVNLTYETCFEKGQRDVFGKENVLRKSIYNLAAWGNVGLKFNL